MNSVLLKVREARPNFYGFIYDIQADAQLWSDGYVAIRGFRDEIEDIIPVEKMDGYAQKEEMLDQFWVSPEEKYVAMRGSRSGIRSNRSSRWGGRKYEYDYFMADKIGKRIGRYLAANGLHVMYYNRKKASKYNSLHQSASRRCFFESFEAGVSRGYRGYFGLEFFDAEVRALEVWGHDVTFGVKVLAMPTNMEESRKQAAHECFNLI